MAEAVKEIKKDKLLTLDEILKTDDVDYVTAEAFGGKLRFGSLSASTMMDFAEANKDPRRAKTAGVRIVLQSLVDEDGKRIGTEALIDPMMQKSSRTINHLVQIIMRLNRMHQDGEIDIAGALRECGTDPVKLGKLADELAILASRVRDAGTDPKKLQEIIDEPVSRAQEERKNG